MYTHTHTQILHKAITKVITTITVYILSMFQIILYKIHLQNQAQSYNQKWNAREILIYNIWAKYVEINSIILIDLLNLNK